MFDGTTGVTIRSSNMTLAKTATGEYSITCAPSIQNGGSDWGVVITNVDDGRWLTGTLGGGNYGERGTFQSDNWNVWLHTRSNTGFTLRSKRFNPVVLSGNFNDDQTTEVIFERVANDPNYIALVVF